MRALSLKGEGFYYIITNLTKRQISTTINVKKIKHSLQIKGGNKQWNF